MELLLDFFSRYSQKLALVSTIFLVVLITLFVADMAIFILDQMNQPATVEISAAGKDITRSKHVNPTYNIAKLNLFGEVTEQETAQPVDVPETKLNLELQGIFTSEKPERSSAIVAQAGKDGILYYPGDRLPGNVTLSAVYDDHILLKRGTRFESLKFSDDAFRSPGNARESGSKPGASTVPTSRQQSNTSRVSNSYAQQKSRNQRQARSQRSSSTNRRSAVAPSSLSEFIDSNREKIEQDPSSLLKELGVSSVASGQAEGYQLSGEIPDAILRKSGLQRGDVILSVNGEPVGNVMEDSALVDAAVAAGRVRVEVKREDRRFFVTVPVR